MNIKKIINCVAIVATIIVNGLATLLPINGKTTGEISDYYPTMFTPAGYVFSIWGLIYLGLIGFCVFQFLPDQISNKRIDKISPFLWASCIFNIAWIILWHYELMAITVPVMIALLVSLIFIHLKLESGRRKVSALEYLLTNLPFSIYLGWISVATIANIAVALFAANWDGLGIPDIYWTITVLIIATGLGVAMLILRHDYAYPLVLIWAFGGIIYKLTDTQPSSVSYPNAEPVVTTAWFTIVVLAIGFFFVLWRDREQHFKEEAEHQKAIRDPLTNMFNRLYVNEFLKKQFPKSMHTGKPISLIVIGMNTPQEQTQKDAIMRSIGGLLQNTVRSGDVACRYGDDSFVVILPGAPLHVAQERAATLQEKISKDPSGPHPYRVIETFGLSIGMTQISEDDIPTTVLKPVDAILSLF